MYVITKTNELTRLCDALSGAEYVTVDTEFMRDHTYWPKLCLIQIAGEGHEAIIDPLSPDIDLTPFFQLMRAPGVIKVFHAARQDIEIFVHLADTVPCPLFDTQLAAMVCGFGEQPGYDALVRKLTDQRIDKTARFTDWSHRPLSRKQLNYALADVTHLRDVYKALRAQLEKSGRQHWLDEEMATLTDLETYRLRPENAWRRLKIRSFNPRFLGILREVCAWREIEARRRDIPRNRVLRDEALLEISAHPPQNADGFAKIRGVPQGFGRSAAARDLANAVKKGLDASEDQLPKLSRPKPLSTSASAVAELLRVLLKMKCGDYRVAPKLVATAADLERLAGEDQPDIAALHGWRYEIFGADAQALKKGKLLLGHANGGVALFSRPNDIQPLSNR